MMIMSCQAAYDVGMIADMGFALRDPVLPVRSVRTV